MRKRGYVLATDFSVQIKSVIDNTINEYKPEISKVLQKAQKVVVSEEKLNLDNKNNDLDELEL